MGEVLVLNGDVQPYRWNPISAVNWKWAIKAYFLEKIDVLAWYEQECRSPSMSMKIPSIVILRTYHQSHQRVNFTKRNVFLRDRYRCQYCSKSVPLSELTCDHVIPRSKGGMTNWKNVVTCCKTCNRNKGHRTDIQPLHFPKEMNYWEMVKAVKDMKITIPDIRWQTYLQWPNELVRILDPKFE